MYHLFHDNDAEHMHPHPPPNNSDPAELIHETPSTWCLTAGEAQQIRVVSLYLTRGYTKKQIFVKAR